MQANLVQVGGELPQVMAIELQRALSEPPLFDELEEDAKSIFEKGLRRPVGVSICTEITDHGEAQHLLDRDAHVFSDLVPSCSGVTAVAGCGEPGSDRVRRELREFRPIAGPMVPREFSE